MGFYLRKSINVGPLRFNLSKSGVGVSAGVTGLRFGVGPRGNYVHMGRGGLYYRATLPPSSLPRSKPPRPFLHGDPSIPSGTHAPLDEIESADVSQIVDSSSQQLLDELNRKRAKARLWPVVAFATVVVLGIGVFLSWHMWLLTSFVLVGVAATYVAHARDTLEKTAVLFYDFDSDMDVAYAQLHNAASQLASCAGVWHIEASGKVHDRKYHAGASELLRRKNTFIRKAEPPYVKTNIETIAVGVGRQTLHFFPDRVLVYDQNAIGAVGYHELRIGVETTRFIESDSVPRDAEIVDRTWRYVNKSGGADRRFNGNREIPVCRYEEITFFSQTGLNEVLQISRCGFGNCFADAISQLGKKLPKGSAGAVRPKAVRVEREEVRKVETAKQAEREPIKMEPTLAPIEKRERAQRETQIPSFAGASHDGELPPLSLLDEPKPQTKGYSEETLAALSRQVEFKLKDFRIDAQVVSAHPGPIITRFEVQPAAGIKGSQISSLDKDIARGLSVVSVRVVDVIPGKSVIGLEIPNTHREIVYLSEILSSGKYDALKSPLALALGKDIGGAPVVVDLQKMPHLLVSGTTGSGKSVALNAMVLSLLYKASARDVRMIMIDPKMLELSVYQGIPHLLAPVVTDMKEAANALRWCVAEMERRYKLMSVFGVRNLAGFNKKIKDAADVGQPLFDPLFRPDLQVSGSVAELLAELPSIAIVMDGFLDQLIVGADCERRLISIDLLQRLSQRAHVAGIHLILTVQSFFVGKVADSLNLEGFSHLVFRQANERDSLEILGQMGAELLESYGDMLWLPRGANTAERVHGAFVDDHEVRKVVGWLLAQSEPQNISGVLEDVQSLDNGKVIGESGLPEHAVGEGASGDYDELYDQAVRIVTETRRASISGVQRRLKIGYNRAARMIELMEQEGVVTAPETNGNRTVLAPPPPER